ncbi:hypothetical protein EMIT0324P_50368 [Pseudomonas chlororaphis]
MFFNNSGSSSWASSGNSSGNAEGFFHCFDQLNNFQNGFLADCFDDLLVSQRHDYKFLYWGDSLRSHQIKHMILKGLAVP